MYAPVASHEVQIGFWNNVLLDFGVSEIKPLPEQEHILKVEQHHHIAALTFGVQQHLNNIYGEGKKTLEVLYSADDYDRAVLRVTDGGYVAVATAEAIPAYSVEVSYYVYPENITSFKAVKKDGKVGEDEVEDDKAQKHMLKSDANIPVVFKTDDKGITRHYQESMPMHKHPGMTNRLLINLVKEVAFFLVSGQLPAEPTK